jgi:RimJ/RimL family protein N-acetyltransferase
MKQFVKTAKLRDGSSVAIRNLDRKDGPALLAFFRALPNDDRQFLKQDVTQNEVIDRLIEENDYDRVFRIIAEKDSAIIGDASLHFNKYGWQRHMAEIRCVVAREFQQKSLGTALMRELLAFADERGVSKISAAIMDTQESAQMAFQRLGFNKEAELRDFVMDLKGKTHNLVIMVNNVSELWRRMEDLLIYHDMRTGS